MRWLDSTTNSIDMNFSKLWEIVETENPGMLQCMRLQRVGHSLVTEQQQPTLFFLGHEISRLENQGTIKKKGIDTAVLTMVIQGQRADNQGGSWKAGMEKPDPYHLPSPMS